MENDIDQKWLSQLRKGYLELCLLTILSQRESSYGFELLQLFETSGLAINEGTLYPLLNRMHKNGWLESHWETPTESGHPRRFYQLSNAGKKQLPHMHEAFEQHQRSLKNLRKLK